MLTTDEYLPFASCATNNKTGLTDGWEHCVAVGIFKIFTTLTGILEDFDRVLIFVCDDAAERRDEKEKSQNGLGFIEHGIGTCVFS